MNSESGTVVNEHVEHKSSDIHQNKDIYNDILERCLCPNQIDDNCSDCNTVSIEPGEKDSRVIIEASCKGNLGLFYCIVSNEIKDLIKINDMIIISHDEIIEMASVVKIGGLVSIKRHKLKLCGESLPVVLRKADDNDILTLKRNSHEETRADEIFRVKMQKYNLNMKLVDVHYQFDRNKLYFFYTADGRIDFRELAKDLASSFRTRIELRQIGVRDEAKRIGGLGTCGREFCCSSFLTNFKKITTQLASEQNGTSGFSKLSGPCGKLKCCLSFETKEVIHEDAQGAG
ncbi:MAG: regulatory iron-sulfur-containing complex subunit RicT [Ignavibacteria bacterium]